MNQNYGQGGYLNQPNHQMAYGQQPQPLGYPQQQQYPPISGQQQQPMMGYAQPQPMVNQQQYGAFRPPSDMMMQQQQPQMQQQQSLENQGGAYPHLPGMTDLNQQQLREGSVLQQKTHDNNAGIAPQQQVVYSYGDPELLGQRSSPGVAQPTLKSNHGQLLVPPLAPHGGESMSQIPADLNESAQQIHTEMVALSNAGGDGQQRVQQPASNGPNHVEQEQEEVEAWSATGPKHKCYYENCGKVAPFQCTARVACKDVGCGKWFCERKEHRGELSLFFMRKIEFEEDRNNEETEHEAVCFDCHEDVNRRIKCAIGIPTVILWIGAVICLFIDVFGIVDAINDASFDAVLEPYTP